MKISLKTMAALALTVWPLLGLAAGTHAPQGEPTDHGAAGLPGDPAKVNRTIAVEMNDSMRFTPDKVEVKAGETIRFFIVNKGKLQHEMVIGIAEEIDEHAVMMKQMPGMVHKEPNQINLAPGQRGGIVWKFTNAGTVSYVCLVPGHKEAGMVGAVNVN